MFPNIIFKQEATDDDNLDVPAFVSISDIKKEIFGDSGEPRNQNKNSSTNQISKSLETEEQKQREQKLQRYRELAAKRNRKKSQTTEGSGIKNNEENQEKKNECCTADNITDPGDQKEDPLKIVPEITHIDIKEEVCEETMEIELEPSQIYECQDESEFKKALSSPVLPSMKFQCPDCPYWTQRKNVLEIHQKIHTKNRVRAVTLLNCSQCKFKTIYIKALERHEAKFHKKFFAKRKKGESIPCNKCSYKAISNNDLMLHKSSEHNDKTALLRCPHCSFKTELMTSLSNHLMCHKDVADSTRYTCDMCLFQSKSMQGLSRHRRTTHKNNVRVFEPAEIYACEECDFTSMHKTSLQYHRMTHQKDEDSLLYKCDQCPHQTKFKWGLNAHKKTHLKAEERPTYACEECEYETFYKGNLKSHYEVVHRGKRVSRNTQCEQCGFVSRYKKKMREHTRLMHAGTEMTLKSEKSFDFDNEDS